MGAFRAPFSFRSRINMFYIMHTKRSSLKNYRYVVGPYDSSANKRSSQSKRPWVTVSIRRTVSQFNYCSMRLWSTHQKTFQYVVKISATFKTSSKSDQLVPIFIGSIWACMTIIYLTYTTEHSSISTDLWFISVGVFQALTLF